MMWSSEVRHQVVRSLVGPLTCAALVALTTDARAQTAAEQAAAQALFEDAQKLQKEGNLAEACPKFRQSFRLEGTIGTLINLARCYEQQGKLASAWISYMQVAADAKTAGQSKRERFARGKVRALKPSLSMLTVSVSTPTAGLTIHVGEEQLSESVWGTAVPTDSGELVVRAEAPGKKPWTQTIKLDPGGATASLTIPALEDLPVAPVVPEPAPAPLAPPPDLGEEPGPDLTMPIVGWTAVVLGLGGVGAGVALRFLALGKDDESLAFCAPDDPTFCDQPGVDLRDDARTFQMASLIAFVAGGVLTGTGVALVVTDAVTGDDGAEGEAAATLRFAPIAGPGVVGLTAVGSF